MSQQNQPCDPVILSVATAIARRCTAIIEPLLRIEERPEFMREAFKVAREELERLPAERQQYLPIYGRKT